MMRKGIIASILIFSISLSFGQSINDKNLKQINSSINLFKTSYSESKNTLISPISVSIAMAMAYEGAKGETAKEFMNILSFAKNKTKHRKFYSETIKELNSSSQSQLKIANIIVAQKNYSFLKRYFKNLKAYETLVKYADFANPEERKKTQEDINNWVSENTKNKIKNLIKENSFDHLTRLVIVNAISFNADWEIEFAVGQTRQMTFHTLNNQVITKFINGFEKFKYYDDENMQAIELPYSGKQFSLVAIVPAQDESFNNFINSFDAKTYQNIINNLEEKEVEVLIPKFIVSDEIDVKEIFKSLGMSDAFTGKANFKAMTGKKDLYIDKILHRTFLKLDEKGTEASGATAVIINQKSTIKKHALFNANRTFLYFIKDNKNENILFIGSMINPINNFN